MNICVGETKLREEKSVQTSELDSVLITHAYDIVKNYETIEAYREHYRLHHTVKTLFSVGTLYIFYKLTRKLIDVYCQK